MQKIRHIQLAANDYIMNTKDSFKGYRIDVIEVTEKGIEHFEDIQI